MTLPSRAAAIRGDDYQHAIGAYHVCRLLNDPDIASVSIEDAQGGAFDDVVVRVRPDCGKAHEYVQIKSSNYNNQIIDEAWLLKTKTPKGKSPHVAPKMEANLHIRCAFRDIDEPPSMPSVAMVLPFLVQ